MKLFDKEKAARLRQQNKKSLYILGIGLLAAGAVCLACVCLAQRLGRWPCQLLATAVTAVYGCAALVQGDRILHRKKQIALCERIPGQPYRALICSADSCTTTLEGLTFCALEALVDGKRKTLYLDCREDPAAWVGKTLCVTSWEHILFSMEVAS